jgi:hypothetical protein
MAADGNNAGLFQEEMPVDRSGERGPFDAEFVSGVCSDPVICKRHFNTNVENLVEILLADRNGPVFMRWFPLCTEYEAVVRILNTTRQW